MKDLTFEELKKYYIQKVHDKVERRPCNADKRIDGKYNYIHQEDVIDIVLELLTRHAQLEEKVKKLEAKNKELIGHIRTASCIKAEKGEG